MRANDVDRRTILVGLGGALVGLSGCIGVASGPGNDDAVEEPTAEDDGSGTAGEDDHEEESAHGSDHDDDGHEDAHDDAVGDAVEHAEVRMVSTADGEHFEPHVVRVQPGGTVRWINESGMHSTTAYAEENDKPHLMPEGATPWDSGLLTEAGADFEHTFEQEGVYHYYCTPHEEMGMIGSLIVGDPDPHDQPALAEPPAEMPHAVREKLASLNETCNEALGHTH